MGVPVWLKLESLQLTGSFKIRGALFAVSKLNGSHHHLLGWESWEGCRLCGAGGYDLRASVCRSIEV